MRKTITIFLISCLMLTVLSGCGASSKESVQSGQSDAISYAEKYIDLSQYTHEENSDEYTSQALYDGEWAIRVNDTALTLGMSYQDVLNSGFKPNNDETADKEINNSFITLFPFTDPQGESVLMGFTGEDGQTIKEGVLYGVSWTEKNTTASVNIDGINADASIENILKQFGQPRRVKRMESGKDEQLFVQYRLQGKETYLSFNIWPSTGEIAEMTINGV